MTYLVAGGYETALLFQVLLSYNIYNNVIKTKKNLRLSHSTHVVTSAFMHVINYRFLMSLYLLRKSFEILQSQFPRAQSVNLPILSDQSPKIFNLQTNRKTAGSIHS